MTWICVACELENTDARDRCIDCDRRRHPKPRVVVEQPPQDIFTATAKDIEIE